MSGFKERHLLHRVSLETEVTIKRKRKKGIKSNSDRGGCNVRGEILRRLGPHERLTQLDGHALLRLRPAPWAVTLSIAGDTCDGLLLHVTADTVDADAVEVLKVIAEIKLIEGEGDAELSVVRREFRGAD